MKKLFSLIAALVLVLSLSACTEDLQPKVTELETKITELEAQITTLEDAEAALETAKADLEAQIALLQAQLFDKVITLSVTTMDGTVQSNTIGVNDDYEGTLFDLLSASFDVTATVSQYGHMVTGLEDLKPSNGAYISFLKNGEASMVGVDGAVFEDGDVFSFELSWWDMTEKAVSDALDLFLVNKAADYVNATSIDYSVISALSILGVVEDYVTQAEVQTYVDGLTLTTTNDYFKAIVILEAAGLDSTSLQTTLATMAAPASYGGTGYQLQAFNANETTVDFSAFQALALTDYATNTPVNAGIDSGAIGVIALSNYQDETGVDTLINDWVSYIKTNQTENGSILDKDFGWGQTENGSTMAQAILGLVSAGVNPKGGDTTGTDMTKLNYNLVGRLIDFQNEDGTFNWTIDAETADLGFTTPQAFFALAAYYEFSNTYQAVNPYDFK